MTRGKITSVRGLCVLLSALVAGSMGAGEADAEHATRPAAAKPEILVHDFLPVEPISRARRPARVSAIIENAGEDAVELQVGLVLPAGIKTVGASAPAKVLLDESDETKLTWVIEADQAGQYDLALRVRVGALTVARASLSMGFLAPVERQKLKYIPEPKPAPTSLLIGALDCPLWEADKPEMWAQIRKHPERTPALGFYAGENPEVADWETKWAVEHGVSYFVYCWYRTSQGEPVKTMFSSAIHDALFKSRYGDKMKFAIMWTNWPKGTAGVADEKDLMTNLLPYWMDHYFKRGNYLKLDNKPVLFIYRPEFLPDDLGGEANVVKAFDHMRQACRDAGFDGLYLLGEYRGVDPNQLALMKRLGLDYTFAYCWPLMNNPTPQQAVAAQMWYIRKTQELGILPQVVTVSQAWSGWADEGSIWKIPPEDYEGLLRQAKDFAAGLPASQLGSRMILLDNWNEWGEGHYIAPYREYGFGYLDAVRKVFSSAPELHTDLIPEDLGLGPYDKVYRAYRQREEEQHRLAGRRVYKTGAPEDGLIGWWAFDEAKDSPVALDYSGNRLGGALHDAQRAKGLDGSALVCKGGSVIVENSPALSPTSELTIECWVKADVTGQHSTWMVNRVFAGGIATGYRLGTLEGKPCFEIPLTDWSHHLKADVSLPAGRWVHLAGTFDGRTMRIYVDGEERGTMERPGPINPNNFHLCLGNFEEGHEAHFDGLLDEVKLYGRALSAAEIRAHFRALAGRAAVKAD